MKSANHFRRVYICTVRIETVAKNRREAMGHIGSAKKLFVVAGDGLGR
jgi:hypothetical protein